MDDDKRQEKTAPVYYVSGEVVRIKRVPWMKTDDLWSLLRDALSLLIECNLMPGECFCRDNRKIALEYLDKISDMVPVVGGGKLDYTQMDLDEIIRVFFTATTELGEEGELQPTEGRGFPPSVISKLQGFDFFKVRGSAVNKAREKIKPPNPNKKEETTTNTAPEPESEPSPS